MISGLIDAARRVGNTLEQWAAARRFAGEWHGTQFKAEVDMLAEQLWLDQLHAIAPGTTVVTEEDVRSHRIGRGDYWLVDPLDGTASFVGDFSGWVTQAAWCEDGRPSLAVVFAPRSNELFHAQAGGGAFVDGVRLRRPDNAVATTLIDNYPDARGIAADALLHFALPRYIECGSIGLKICRVAAGAADLFIKDVKVKSWDVAPGDLILTEVGGAVTSLNGDRLDYARSLAHDGLIATRSVEFAASVAHWQKSRRGKPVAEHGDSQLPGNENQRPAQTETGHTRNPRSDLER
jgi:3'(2'), 5'-bisphosphate nucleotidase